MLRAVGKGYLSQTFNFESQVLLGFFLCQVCTVVVALNVLENGFHLLGLSLPLFLVHFRLASEKFLVRLTVAASKTVPESCELSIVVVEVEMVHRMAGRAVDYRAVGDIFPVMDQDGPQVDEPEKDDVGEFLKREDEREQMVRNALRPAIQRMECVRCIRTGHDPLVMRLVERLVNQRVVQSAMDPIDAKIGEGDEQGELQEAVVGEGLLGESIVELRIPPNLGDQEWRGQQGHDGHGPHGLGDLHGDLVFKELGVLDGGLVPNEDV